MNVILETERLVLRELELTDTAELSKVLSDEESMKYYPRPFTAREVNAWIERNIERYAECGYGLWAVIEKKSGVFVGDCGITMQDIDGSFLPEIGFHIITCYRGRGYAAEAAAACRDYAFTYSGFDRVYSYTGTDNLAAQKVALKIGMKEIKRYVRNGISLVVFEYLRP